MTESEPTAGCSDCGAVRPQAPGPCPECGSRNRTIGVGMASEKETAGSVRAGKGVSVGMATEKDTAMPVGVLRTVRGTAGKFVKEHPKWSATAAVLTVGGAVAGLFGPPWGVVGGALALLAYLAQRRAFK